MQPSASDERDLIAYTGDAPTAARTSRTRSRARRPGRRVIPHIVNSLIAGGALLAILGPAVAFLIALSWGVVTYARSVMLLVDLVHARNFGALGPQLHQLNLAARFTLLSAGYFALIFSMIVVYAGVLGRRRQRALLLPGILLVAQSIVAYLLGVVLASASVSAATGIAIEVFAAFFLYALVDAFALGVLLADTRAPVHRARRFMRRRRYFLWQRMPYYSRRLQSRYTVFREALREEEHSAPPLPEPDVATTAAAKQVDGDASATDGGETNPPDAGATPTQDLTIVA